jgi:hypothetical protein
LFDSGEYYLSERIEVRNISLSLKPLPSVPAGSVSIACNSSNAGFVVRDVEFAELSGVKITSCSRPLEFINVQTVHLLNSTFESFHGGGGVNIYDCTNVVVEDCVFANSTSTTEYTQDRFRGSSGGLSVSSSSAMPSPRFFTVRQSFFVNLSSEISENDFGNPSPNNDYLTTFLGRGGGMSVVVYNSTDLELVVSDCQFTSNKATLNAGGLHVFLHHISTGLSVMISNSMFTNNRISVLPTALVNNGGGAVGVTLYEGSHLNLRNVLVLSNNVFSHNQANYAGALYIVSASVLAAASVDVTVLDSVFTGNSAIFSGSAISLSASVQLTGRTTQGGRVSGIPRKPVLQNIVCRNNSAQSGGVVFISNYNVVFRGSNTFEDNNGTALRVISSLIIVSEELYFHGNDARNSEGGALHISNGELELTEDSAVVFESNQGSLGAAIVSEPIYTLPNYIKAPFNPLCFFGYEDRRAVVQNWRNTEVIFASNRADVGSAVYSEEVGLCSHQGTNLNFTTASLLTYEPPFIYSDNTNSRYPNVSDPVQQISSPVAGFDISCRVDSGSGSTSGPCDELLVYPGQLVFLDITAYDELHVSSSPLDHETYGLFSLRVDPNSKDSPQEIISLDPTLYSVYPDTGECPFVYSINVAKRFVTRFEIGVEANRFAAASTLDLLPMKSFNITRIPCPVGHAISEETGMCSCQYSSTLLTCDANRLVLKRGYWGLSVRSQEATRPDQLLTFKCPPGFCRCIFDFRANSTITTFAGCNAASTSSSLGRNSTSSSTCTSVFDVFQPDRQCSCNRTGYLCGACANGTAVTALLNRCRVCPPASSVAIAFLVIVDAAVMIALCTIPVFWHKFHFPSSLYGLLFYIQIVPYAVEDFQYANDIFYRVVRFIGSLFGMYFPWDACLSPTTTALGAYAARYIPTLIALVVTPSSIAIMWFFRKKVTLTYNGVWFVWMLILNDLLATSFSILNCPILPDESGTLHSVWYYDGTVRCFVDPGHAVLAIWAIIVLLLIVAAMAAILFVLLQSERLKLRRILRRIGDPVQIGFLDEYKFWFFIDFLLRFIFIAIVVYEKDNESAGIYFISIIFIIYAYFKPFRILTDNILELILLAIFFMALLLRQSEYLGDIFQNQFMGTSSAASNGCSEAEIPLNWFNAVLGIVFCAPVLLFAMPLVVVVLRKCSNRCAFLMKEKRQRKKRKGRYTLNPTNPHVTTVELTALDDLVVIENTPSKWEYESEESEVVKGNESNDSEQREKAVNVSDSFDSNTISFSGR